jgi:hypothetical protein
VGLKDMLKRWLDEGRALGELRDDVNTDSVTGMLFAGMMGASVVYGVEKSSESLDLPIDTLIDYLEGLKP